MQTTTSRTEKGSEYCLPIDIPEVVDNTAVLQFIKTFRKSPKLSCPRCQSTFTKHVNSSASDDLSRCIDCGYMFNSLSGTVFQGTKLPVAKIVQAIIIVDSDISASNLREMSYALDVSYKTALGILRKIQKYPVPDPYILFDGDYAEFDFQSSSEFQKFGHLSAVHKLNLNRIKFYKRLATMLDIENQKRE